MIKRKIIFILLVIFFFSCDNKQKKEDRKLEHEIVTLLDSIRRENKNTFQLSGLSVNWDSLLIIPPYTVLKDVKASTKLNVEILEQTEIEFRDNVCVLAFLKDGQINSFAEIGRIYDFSELPSDKFYSKGQVFELISDPLTKSRYVIKRK